MERRVRMASLKIRTGRASELEMALLVLQQGDVEVGFIQGTKVVQGINTQNVSGYYVWATKVESMRREESQWSGGRQRGGSWRARPVFPPTW